MFGFLGSIVSATIKTVVTPLAIVKDVVTGTPFETTEEVIDSIKDDIEEAFED
jgi:hypothetical protein